MALPLDCACGQALGSTGGSWLRRLHEQYPLTEVPPPAPSLLLQLRKPAGGTSGLACGVPPTLLEEEPIPVANVLGATGLEAAEALSLPVLTELALPS